MVGGEGEKVSRPENLMKASDESVLEVSILQNADMSRERAEDYRIVPVSGVYGGHRPDHFELVVRTDTIDANASEDRNRPVVRRVDQVCLRMSPEQAKSLHKWLGQHVEAFEQNVREIGESTEEKGAGETDEGSPMFR